MNDPNLRFLENHMIVTGFPPAALSTARVADVVSLKNYRRCAVCFHSSLGTAGNDPTITILQGTDVAFGTNKALNFTEVYVKQDLTHLSDVGQWTKVTQAAANTYTDTTSAEQEKIWVIEFKAEDLDIANNYDCIRAQIGDVGTSTDGQIGTIWYILSDPYQVEAPENMPSAIID
jgi:hypothetical protein